MKSLKFFLIGFILLVGLIFISGWAIDTFSQKVPNSDNSLIIR